VTAGAGAVRAWLSERRARASLRACDAVGPHATVIGRPLVHNGGSVRIGRSFRFASVPAPSHLVCGRGVIEIGDDVSIGHGAGIVAWNAIRIGSGARIGPYAVIIDTDFHVVGQRDREAPTEPIAIGRDVRLGAHVTVLRGSTIGDGAIVEAGSVVAGAVAAGAHVAGVPARPVGGAALPLPGHAGAGDVPEVVRRALGLAGGLAPEDGPSTVPQWDSLGGLRVLLALEEAFGVGLSEDVVLRVATVADLMDVVARAVGRRHAVAESAAPHIQ
jgi:acetyltransferase-like isoleucine patch superfamily enzyme